MSDGSGRDGARPPLGRMMLASAVAAVIAALAMVLVLRAAGVEDTALIGGLGGAIGGVAGSLAAVRVRARSDGQGS